MAQILQKFMADMHLKKGKEVSDFVENILNMQGKHLLLKTYKDEAGSFGRYLADIHLS